MVLNLLYSTLANLKKFLPRSGIITTTTPHLINSTQRLHKFDMAGGKKKKKPASNPARGFATTSIASKPKAEIIGPESLSSTDHQGDPETAQKEQIASTNTNT